MSAAQSHEKNWEALTTAMYKLPPFLIFYGEQDIGKSIFAQKFAAHVLKESFENLSKGARHNYRHLNFGGAEIKIDDTHPIRDFLENRYDDYKVLIIDNADSLNSHAANSLLKLFERSYDKTFVILIVHNIYKFPVTLRSRFFEIAFEEDANYIISPLNQWLQNQGGEVFTDYLSQLLAMTQWESDHDNFVAKYKDDYIFVLRVMKMILYKGKKVSHFERLNKFMIHAQHTHIPKEDYIVMGFLMGGDIKPRGF